MYLLTDISAALVSLSLATQPVPAKESQVGCITRVVQQDAQATDMLVTKIELPQRRYPGLMLAALGRDRRPWVMGAALEETIKGTTLYANALGTHTMLVTADGTAKEKIAIAFVAATPPEAASGPLDPPKKRVIWVIGGANGNLTSFVRDDEADGAMRMSAFTQEQPARIGILVGARATDAMRRERHWQLQKRMLACG